MGFTLRDIQSEKLTDHGTDRKSNIESQSVSVFRRLVSRYMMDRTVPSSATFSGLLIETNYFLCFQVKAFMNDLVCSISSRMCTYYKIKFG